MRLACRRPDPQPDIGYATAELLMGIALLLLPVTVIVLTLPTWAERRSMAHSLAYQASVAVTESRDWVEGRGRADRIAEEMARNYHLRPAEVELSWDPDRENATLERGEKVTAVVRVTMPGLVVPGVQWSILPWKHTIRHSEIVDRYRSL